MVGSQSRTKLVASSIVISTGGSTDLGIALSAPRNLRIQRSTSAMSGRYASKGGPDLIGAQPLPLFDNLIDAPRTIHPPICTTRRCPSPTKPSVSLGGLLP